MALTKIGNIKGPKGDKGDKTKISIGNVQEGFEPEVSANTDANGDVSLDFVLPRGPRGYGITGVTGTKVDGATKVVIHFEDGTDSQAFRLLDGLNGDGLSELTQVNISRSTKKDFIKEVLLYAYNNISTENKLTHIKAYDQGSSYGSAGQDRPLSVDFLAYKYTINTPGYRYIYLLDIFENCAYRCRTDSLTTTSTISEISYEKSNINNLYNIITDPETGETVGGTGTRLNLITEPGIYNFQYNDVHYLMFVENTSNYIEQKIIYSNYGSNFKVINRYSFDRGSNWSQSTKTIATKDEVEKVSSDVGVHTRTLSSSIGPTSDDNIIADITKNGAYTFSDNGRFYFLMNQYGKDIGANYADQLMIGWSYSNASDIKVYRRKKSTSSSTWEVSEQRGLNTLYELCVVLMTQNSTETINVYRTTKTETDQIIAGSLLSQNSASDLRKLFGDHKLKACGTYNGNIVTAVTYNTGTTTLLVEYYDKTANTTKTESLSSLRISSYDYEQLL